MKPASFTLHYTLFLLGVTAAALAVNGVWWTLNSEWLPNIENARWRAIWRALLDAYGAKSFAEQNDFVIIASSTVIFFVMFTAGLSTAGWWQKRSKTSPHLLSFVSLATFVTAALLIINTIWWNAHGGLLLGATNSLWAALLRVYGATNPYHDVQLALILSSIAIVAAVALIACSLARRVRKPAG